MKPLVSICIPVYKNTHFLARLLESLLQQTYSNFEVIISDDSPDASVEEFVRFFNTKLQIRYFRNTPALGTPANWNFAMQQAYGNYIKLIHDDDWLADSSALARMVETLENNPKASFVVCAYNNIDLVKKTKKTVIAKSSSLKRITQHPLLLFKANIIGPPSVIMHRKSFSFQYDENLKWVVDFEAYIRCLQNKHLFTFIRQPIINVGISNLQVTKTSSHIREVEIPENLYMLQKQGLDILNNIYIFDYYWRLLRNLSIKNSSDITNSGWSSTIPQPILRMLAWQKHIAFKCLKIGALSKLLMFLCFISRKFK